MDCQPQPVVLKGPDVPGTDPTRHSTRHQSRQLRVGGPVANSNLAQIKRCRGRENGQGGTPGRGCSSLSPPPCALPPSSFYLRSICS